MCITKKRTTCSYSGCTNNVQNSGVCCRHGAKVKLCSYPQCNNNSVKGGVCRSHGAKKKKCSIPDCTSFASKGGICYKHGGKGKQCTTPGCTIISKRHGLCCRHGAYKVKSSQRQKIDLASNGKDGLQCRTRSAKPSQSSDSVVANKKMRVTTEELLETTKADAIKNIPFEAEQQTTSTSYSSRFNSGEANRAWDTSRNPGSILTTNESNNPLLAPGNFQSCQVALTWAGEKTKSPFTVDHGSNAGGQSGGKEYSNADHEANENQILTRTSTGSDDIDVDTLLQIPFYISCLIGKVGFAKYKTGDFLPVLFLGPNDVPSYVRHEWLKRFQVYSQEGVPMLHLVTFYGHATESGRFGLVNDVYLYEESLERNFRRIAETKINTKLWKGEALNEAEVRFNRAFAELFVARNLPEERRWAWKTARFVA